MSARTNAEHGTAASLATFVFAVCLAPALAPVGFFFMASVGWMWGGEVPRWAHLPFVGYGLLTGTAAALELLIVRFVIARWAGTPERAEVAALAVSLGAFAGAVAALLLLVLATRGDLVAAVRDGRLVLTAIGMLALIWSGAFVAARVRVRTPPGVDIAVCAAVAIATAIVLPPSLAYLSRLLPL